MDFQIADLSQNQKSKLHQVEDELGVVLIAWEKDGSNERNNDNKDTQH
jgi:hypothetical protein